MPINQEEQLEVKNYIKEILDLYTEDEYEINIKNYTIKELLNYIISKKLYKKDSELNIFIYRLIQFLLFETFYLSKDNKIYDLYKYFILKMNNTIKYNLDIESLFFEFKNTLINE